MQRALERAGGAGHGAGDVRTRGRDDTGGEGGGVEAVVDGGHEVLLDGSGGVVDGQQFRINDGVQLVTFEFDSDGVFIDIDNNGIPDQADVKRIQRAMYPSLPLPLINQVDVDRVWDWLTSGTAVSIALDLSAVPATDALRRYTNPVGHQVVLYAPRTASTRQVRCIDPMHQHDKPAALDDELLHVWKIIAEKGMQDRVTRIGYVPDGMMRAYYQQAELFVMPSLFEPFGMTSQEAMACGKPVVASKFGGIRNTIID